MTGVQTCALPICFPVTISAVVDIHHNEIATSVVEGTSGSPITVGVTLSGSSTQNFISSNSVLTQGRPLRANVSPSSFNIDIFDSNCF